MLQFFCYLLLPCAVLARIRVTNDYEKLFLRDDITEDDAEEVFSCIYFTAVRLFDDGNRIGMMCHKCGRLENEIIRLFMKKQAIAVSNRPFSVTRRRRVVSYVVFADEMFAESRRVLLKKDTNFHTVQYLFVSAAREETAIVFAGDLWREGFRDIAFLTLNMSMVSGTVQVPVTAAEIVTLRSVGYCTPSEDNLNGIVPYNSDFHRFCPTKPCTLRYGAVADDTIYFWREEDRLKMTEIQTDGYQPMGDMLIDRFTSFYGIESHNVDDDLSWPKAVDKLVNGELDIVIGLAPENVEVLENLQVVCWYRERTLMFAIQVHREVRDYPVLQLLTPFHYSVWICAVVTLIVYILLLYALKKLADKGLIKERLDFMQVYEIMLGQNITSPQRTSLRTVTALWMIFSFNLSIIYNCTFTSSLADLDTENLMEDLKQARDAGIPIIGPSIVQGFLNDSDDPVIADLRDRYTVMKRADETFEEILSKDDILGVVQPITVDRMNWVTRMDRKLRIYMLPEPVLTYPILFYTRAEHYYRVPFERIVTEYRQSGLLYKWVKYYVIDEDKQIATSRENAQDENAGILTVEHLGSVFQFLYMCQAVSVLVFLVELFKFHIPKIQ